VLGVPVQLASVTIESSANPQIALRAARPENLEIPKIAKARIPNIAIHAGVDGTLGHDAGVEANTPLLVAIVTVADTEPFAAGVSGFWVNVHIESPGREAQLSKTAEANPSIELTVIVVVAVPWVLTVAEDGDAVTVKSGPVATPLPESATVWGLVESLSETLSIADSAAVVVGVNLTLIVQVPVVATRPVPQVLLWTKSEALAPAIVMEVIVRAVLLVFESVAVCAGLVEFRLTLPKLSVPGASVTAPAGAVPDPESDDVWGLLESLSETLRVADSFDVVEGVKTTVIMQLVAAARVAFTAGHELVCIAKSVAFVPLTVTPGEVMVIAAVELLLRVNVWGELGVPCVKLPKLADVGVSVTPGRGVVPVPVKVTVCGLFEAPE
jgi:hypothetical protein